MKRNRYLWMIALVATLAIAIPGYSQLSPKSNTLFQHPPLVLFWRVFMMEKQPTKL